MTTQELIRELQRLGVRLRLAGERLDVLAPPGVLTGELREELRNRRDELIPLLRKPVADAPLPDLVPDPAARHEPFPLTDIQRAYWIGRNPAVDLGGIFTHTYFELDRDALDPEALRRSLRRVIGRHDMLRAVVRPDGLQQVLPDAEIPDYEIAVRDLRDAGPRAVEESLARTRAELSGRSPDPAVWPLFDVALSLLPDGRSRLHFNAANLIADGASLAVVFADWRTWYENPDWDPPPIAVTFRDFVLAEQRSREGARYQAAERYWLERADGLPAAPVPPLARASARCARFGTRRGSLPAERWTVFKDTARKHGATPSAALAAVYGEVLRLWTGRSAATLNLTLFNRPPLHPDLERVVGDFTTPLLLEIEEAPGEPFAARARALSGRLLRDMEHLSYSGVRVLQERARRSGGTPGAAMPIVFTSMLPMAQDGAADMAGARAFFGDLAHAVCETPQVLIDHQVEELDGRLLYAWDAMEEMFPEGLLDDMVAVYHDLLERLTDDPGAWDGTEPPAGLPGWQREERDAANATRADIPARTLGGLVADQIALRPEATAVIDAAGALSYGELCGAARALTERLTALDAGTGELVGVVAPKGRAQVIGALGVTWAGSAYLPIEADWPHARRDQLLAEGAARLVVTTRDLAGGPWPEGTTVVVIPEEGDGAAAPPGERARPGDLAYVIFTSGSTGKPKGVMIDHRGACNTLQDITARFGIGPGDRVLGLSALSFDLSVYDVFGALGAGATLVLPDPGRAGDPGHWSQLAQRHGITVWNSVPALMHAWLDAGPTPPAGPRVVLLSGDWIPVALPGAIRARYPEAQVVSLGGATEASIWSVIYPIGEVPEQWTSIPYGKPLLNQTMHVLGPDLEPCPVWATGEIHIGGTGVALGYWQDRERTRERFIAHPRTGETLYRTGDLGRYLPGGDIEFLGRTDLQVKLNGYRIELGEITATLRRRPEIADACTTVAAHPVTGRRALVAYVVPQEAGLDPDAVRGALEKLLPEYMVPRHYVQIDRIPLSANGKVDPGALPDPWPAQAQEAALSPSDHVEERLLAIWFETLGREDFGVQDNLFELGGDSLHAVNILARVQEDFAIVGDPDEGLHWIFDAPTVAELAVTVRELMAG